jgi:hypothetical protein
VRLRYADGVEAERSENPARPTASEFALRETAARLFEKARGRRIRIRHLEVELSDLRDPPRQLPLFEAPADSPSRARREEALSGALARIRDRYGAEAVGPKRARETPGRIP